MASSKTPGWLIFNTKKMIFVKKKNPISDKSKTALAFINLAVLCEKNSLFLIAHDIFHINNRITKHGADAIHIKTSQGVYCQANSGLV